MSDLQIPEVDPIFSNFIIEKVVIHSIQKDPLNRNPRTNKSSSITELENRGLQTLSSRIINAVGPKSNAIEMKFKSADADTFKKIVSSFNESGLSDEQFLSISHSLTDNLAVSQKKAKNVPDGAVIVIKGTTGTNSTRCFVIIKAETHDGFILENLQSQSSKVEFVENLFMTPQQKFYKVAFIVDNIRNSVKKENVYSVENLRPFIFDSNVGPSDSKVAADYFYNSFMGCDYGENTAVLNQIFYNTTASFIYDTFRDNHEKRWDYITAIKAYMKSTVETVGMNDFAETYLLEPEERRNYYTYMEIKNAPTEKIKKDTKRITNKLKLRKIRFTSGVIISAPQDAFSENVMILDDKLKEELGDDVYGKLTEKFSLTNATVLKISGSLKDDQ